MSLVPQSHEISVCSPGTGGLWTRPAAPVIRVSHPCCVTFLCLVSVTTAQTWPHRPKGDGCRKERQYESSTPGASRSDNKTPVFSLGLSTNKTRHRAATSRAVFPS